MRTFSCLPLLMGSSVTWDSFHPVLQCPCAPEGLGVDVDIST